MDYFQSDVLIFSPANHNNISDERDNYRIWEKQRGNQFWSDGGYYHIIQPGIRNHYAGPDYIHAVIQYPNGEILKGDVEIHTSVSDWYRHKHHMNRHYENVILHVITSGNVLPVFTGETTQIPTIKLGNTILPSYTRECENLSHSLHWDQFMDWISVFSNQRWEYLQSFFGNEPSKIQHRILSFMDIKTNRLSVQKTIDYYCSLPSEIDIETNCTLVTQYAEKLPWHARRHFMELFSHFLVLFPHFLDFFGKISEISEKFSNFWEQKKIKIAKKSKNEGASSDFLEE